MRAGRAGSNFGGLLDQAGGNPVLGLGDRTALGDLDHVAGVELALFVMGVVLARLGNDLAIELVLDAALGEHGHGLGALVAHDLADQGALEGCLGFRHGRFPYLACFDSTCFWARMVLARAMSRRVTRSVPVLVS